MAFTAYIKTETFFNAKTRSSNTIISAIHIKRTGYQGKEGTKAGFKV